MKLFGYENKRVIVSGCFSGMGEATARQLLELGAEVHGIDFKASALPLASFHQVDLRNPATVDAAIAQISQKLNGAKIDALFNCAGLPQTAAPLDVMRVNYAGTRHVTERVIPLMAEGSCIASISSSGGLGWSRRLPLLRELIAQNSFESAVRWCEAHMEDVKEGYTLSKEAIIVWTMLTAQQLIKQGIRINCTLPGPTQTPMMKHFEAATAASVLETAIQPINRRSTPQEQAAALIFLNSDAASYINGIALPVDGGFISGITLGEIKPGNLARPA